MERKDPLHDVDDHCFHLLSQSGLGQPSHHLRVCEKNPEEASTTLSENCSTVKPLLTACHRLDRPGVAFLSPKHLISPRRGSG